MRDRALSLALALLAILLFAGIFIEKKPQLSNSMASTQDQGEQGYAVFFQWLKARNIPVQSWRERWFELDQRFSAGHVLLSNFPYRMQDEKTGRWQDAPHAYVDAREKTAMLRWIAAGNTLVLPIGAFDAEGNTADARSDARREVGNFDLLQALGWMLSGSAAGDTPKEDAQVDDEEEPNHGDTANTAHPKASLDSEIAVANARPQALHALDLQLAPNSAAMSFAPIAWEPQGNLDLRFAPVDSTQECNPTAPTGAAENANADETGIGLRLPTTSIDHSKDTITTDGSTLNYGTCAPLGIRQALVLLRAPSDQSAAGWWLPFGRGGVVIIGYGSLWRNPNLGREGTALAAESLLKHFLKPGGVVLFDDYRFGLSSIYDPDALLKDPRLYKTLGVIAIFWLLYAVGRQYRMLPVRLPVEKPSSATFARAISDFYARSLSDAELAQALVAHFLQNARRAFGMHGDDAAVWARLRRNFSSDTGGLDLVTLENLERLGTGALAGRDNAQLTRLLLQLERKILGAGAEQ
jgi:hypothetical protein